jgi:hypothetical protein
MLINSFRALDEIFRSEIKIFVFTVRSTELVYFTSVSVDKHFKLSICIYDNTGNYMSRLMHYTNIWKHLLYKTDLLKFSPPDQPQKFFSCYMLWDRRISKSLIILIAGMD